ncbi:MAG: ATP-binding cassette domain-containing protein, partial [Lachnospiraceae bacterium]|nr:ATP-binding cassette domain-containing protein [Lachnospiraceae bacterium]
HYTVFENIEMPLLMKRMPRKERKKQVKEALKKVGIEKLAKKLPNQLSGGQQQRCAIARAIVAGNSLILADEPTGALDSNTTKHIMELLKKLNEEGKTILIVTHDEKVAEYTNRVIHIMDGKVVEKIEK